MKEVANMKRRNVLRTLLVAACILTMTVAMTACGTDSTSDTQTSTASEATNKDISAVTSEVDAVTGTPAFFAQDFGNVDAAAALLGKKVMLVAYDSTNDWCVNYVKMAEPIYKKLGADVEITYCDGTSDSWIQAIQSATNQKYDAIDLFGISDIGQLGSAIEEAKAAGVYVQDSHGTDLSDKSSNSTVSIGCDYEKAGELMAMEVINEAGSADKVNCLVVADVGWGADDSVRKGVKKVFDEYGCKYTMADVAITDWTEGIGNAVRNAFIADSTYSSMITYYDNMCIYAVSALEELGISLDDVYIGSFNGSPSMIDYIKDGKMDFDLGESTGWSACHGVDCMARYFAGQDVHNDSGYAMYFINNDNIDHYIDPDTGKASYAYDGVQDVYLKGYGELWGIDLTGVFDGIK